MREICGSLKELGRMEKLFLTHLNSSVFLLDESSGFQAYLNFSQWKWRLLHSEVMRIACFSQLSFVEPSEVVNRPPCAGYC